MHCADHVTGSDQEEPPELSQRLYPLSRALGLQRMRQRRLSLPREVCGARRAGTRSIRSFFAQAMVEYTTNCLPVDADNGGVCSLSSKLPCDGRHIFLLPSLRFGEGRRLGHIAGKLVNVRHHVHKNCLERRDLNDEECVEVGLNPTRVEPTNLTSLRGRLGILKGASSKLLWSGLRKRRRARPLLPQC